MLKNLGDYIMVLDDVLPAPMCEDLIKDFEASELGNEKRVSEFDWGVDNRRFTELNVSNHVDFAEYRKSLLEIHQQLHTFYKERTGSEYLLPFELCAYEGIRMKKYETNDTDQFGWHADVGDGPSSRRQLAMFTYLNDVEEGGETVFRGISQDDAIIRPKTGRTVIFPPTFMFPHKGMKPKSGPKYILSMYTHYV